MSAAKRDPRLRAPAAQFVVSWVDAGREPRCPPNPNHPKGIDLDASGGAAASCLADLPYPAKRVGRFLVECKLCNLRAVATTAGRPDDPRSFRLPCRLLGSA